MYTYKIIDDSESEKWIFIKCIEEDSMFEFEPFVELIKSIARKWNNNEWQGTISCVGDIRYKIKNDPLNLIYQWDDLFGIVFDYQNSKSLENVKAFVSDNYHIF